MDSSFNSNDQKLLNEIVGNIDSNQIDQLIEKLDEIHPAEIANLLESMPPNERIQFWEYIPPENEGEILNYVRDEVRSTIVQQMDPDEIIAAAESMDAIELAEVLEDLPGHLSDSIIAELEDDHRRRLETVLSYDEETAGRIMSTDVLSVRSDVSIAVLLRWLRMHTDLPEHTDALMIVDKENNYLGQIKISRLLTSNPDNLVSQSMSTSAETILDTASYHQLTTLFDRRDLLSVAVINSDNKLLGRITVDDVIDIIREEADATLLKSAGLKEEQDLFAPVFSSAKQRGFWLGLNLITVFFAAWVIGQFQEVLDKIVALAVLMPIVASMGGIAGSQTLTLTIRGLALDQIAKSNIRWLTLKELAIGALNGLVWAIVVGLLAYVWFQNSGIAIIISAAMLLNLLAASISGIIIPITLQSMRIDPALSGAVVLTTVTDVIGFLSFLGLSSLFLL